MKSHTARLHSVLRPIILMMFATLAICINGNATPTTYQVNRIIGTGSVTGFIETDGMIGVLSAGNFIDWNLLLKVGTSTFDLTGPLSGGNSSIFVRGTDVAAFGSFLMFNFSGIDFGVLVFEQGLVSGSHYYCDSTQPFECLPGETVVPGNVAGGFQNARPRGVVVIGTAGSPAPEPATCTLICTALVFLVLKKSINYAEAHCE